MTLSTRTQTRFEKPKRSASTAPVLQRKCACGQHTPAGGECGSCRQKREAALQRSANGGASTGGVPPIVHEVLRAPGRPLDADTRAFMEPRFGQDFSRVRVHTDARASESAEAVNAAAYTVGRDVVFGERSTTTGSMANQRLVAHELAHVTQQSAGSATGNGRLPMGAPDTQQEREAEEASHDIVFGNGTKPLSREAPTLRKHEENRGITLFMMRDRALQPLTEAEKTAIEALTKTTRPTGPALAFTEGPRFVLHDTSSRPKGKTEADVQATETKRHAEHKEGERGPLDAGAAAWVPRAGDAVIARPNFFDPLRPTTTEYERRADLISQADREVAFQKIWKATKTAEQQAALGRALASLELTPQAKETTAALVRRAITERKLTPAEATTERTVAAGELVAALPAKPKKGEAAHIHTTAAWTIGEICAKSAAAGAAAMTDSPAHAKELSDGCAQLKVYFAERDPRLRSSVNVEIVQEADPKCEIPAKTKPADIKRLPVPAYTPDQYQSLVIVYLQAALQAGSFPEITTHFWLDQVAGDHCDPRCFDVPHLYELIAKAIGHPQGSTYGITPNWGTAHGTHNVWWHPIACGGSHP